MAMLQRRVSVARLERKMQIFEDIKKAFFYDKSSGLWYWHDRDEGASTDHGGFGCFMDMLDDAVEPYFEDSE
jgi:hypothetical protein